MSLSFDPFEQMTMASACNRYLCMHCLAPDTISSEPLLGWRGHVNHSKVSMEWLMWQENLLQAETWSNMSEVEGQQHDLMARGYPDYAENHHPLYRLCIQHARNRGEHHVLGTRYTLLGRWVRPGH